MSQKFRFKGKAIISENSSSSEPKQTIQMELNKETINNTSHGDKLNTIYPNWLIICYTNINDMDLGKAITHYFNCVKHLNQKK